MRISSQWRILRLQPLITCVYTTWRFSVCLDGPAMALTLFSEMWQPWICLPPAFRAGRYRHVTSRLVCWTITTTFAFKHGADSSLHKCFLENCGELWRFQAGRERCSQLSMLVGDDGFKRVCFRVALPHEATFRLAASLLPWKLLTAAYCYWWRCRKRNEITASQTSKPGVGEHLIWLASKFSLANLEYKIASKRSSMVSRYLVSRSVYPLR